MSTGQDEIFEKIVEEFGGVEEDENKNVDEQAEVNPLPPEGSNWREFAETFDIGVLDLDKFASLIGYDDFGDLDLGINPRSLYQRDKDKFVEALKASSLKASDMSPEDIEGLVESKTNGEDGVAGDENKKVDEGKQEDLEKAAKNLAEELWRTGSYTSKETADKVVDIVKAAMSELRAKGDSKSSEGKSPVEGDKEATQIKKLSEEEDLGKTNEVDEKKVDEGIVDDVIKSIEEYLASEGKTEIPRETVERYFHRHIDRVIAALQAKGITIIEDSKSSEGKSPKEGDKEAAQIKKLAEEEIESEEVEEKKTPASLIAAAEKKEKEAKTLIDAAKELRDYAAEMEKDLKKKKEKGD